MGLQEALSAVSPKDEPYKEFDLRRAANSGRAFDPRKTEAFGRLRESAGGVELSTESVIRSPKWIYSRTGFLTPPPSTVSISAAGARPPDAAATIKAFVDNYRELFGHGSEALDAASLKREFVATNSGLHTMIWEQDFNGIPVFDGLFIAHTAKGGELVSISSHFVPNPGIAAQNGASSSPPKPAISGQEALILADRSLDGALTADSLTTETPASNNGTGRLEFFRAPSLIGEARVRLVWLPMNRDSMRLAWEVVLMPRSLRAMYKCVVDAQNGEVQLRQCLTENLSDATYRVYLSDSPTPQSPGYSSPIATQPPVVSRVLVVTNALNLTASPKGWIDDGDNLTRGNNVDAYLDADADDLPDQPRTQGSPFRVFDPPIDLSQDPATNADAAIVNLFFWNNWMHDTLYAYGFTEAAGNFQVTNFDRGGVGGDPVFAEAQDSSFLNNARFTTPPDGMPGRMELYLFNGSTPARDPDLDRQVILHEYTHGLSSRRVGGGVGITALQSRGLGEGWSDFVSLALTANPGDDPNACYPEAAYSAFFFFGIEMENYYYGIRRYPYSTDLNKNPGTFKDIDPGQISLHSGIPRNPALLNTAGEIHNQGEIWCAALWDARASFIARYGYAAGNPLILQLVMDAMNLTPANPTFVEARDAVILADLVNNNGTNYHALWTAFARRGLGYSAVAPPSTTTAGVTEAFDVPDDLRITPNATVSISGPIGGPFSFSFSSYQLKNTSGDALNWKASTSVPWLSLSATNGSLAGGGAVTSIVMSASSQANALIPGNYSGVVSFTNLASGISQIFQVKFSVTAPRLYYFALDTDPGWSRAGQWAFGLPSGLGGATHGFPDPASGKSGSNVLGVNLNGDYSLTPGGPFYLQTGPLDFSSAGNITLQFQRWLNTDVETYASATVELSTNGTDWAYVYRNGSFQVTDSTWTNVSYDISSIADGQPAVFVRWGYAINDGAFAFSGWNIDDVQFLGCPALSISFPASVTEGAGLLQNQGHVTIAYPPSSDLTVSLFSSNMSKAIVPASVTIPAGMTSANFDLSIVDNVILDGPTQVAISATSPGSLNATNIITIRDNESANLGITLQASATEGDGIIAGYVNSDSAPAADITVSLMSSVPGRLQVPATVILPSGQTSVEFDATIIDDQMINGDALATITATVDNWSAGNAGITIFDNESTNLSLILPAEIRPSNGILTNAGFVSINGTLSSNLMVSLAATNPGYLTIPASVIIPAGQTSAFFTINLPPFGPPYGAIPLWVTAAANGFSGNSTTINLTDDHTPPAPFNPQPPDLSFAISTPTVLSWSGGLGEGMERLANGDFETGSFAGWTSASFTNGAVVINDGTYFTSTPDGATEPFAGSNSALIDQSLPGSSILYQDVSVPAGASVITVSWEDRIRNFSSAFAGGQQFRVEVRNTNNATLAVVFSTNPGDALLRDWTQRAFNLYGYAGQQIRLAFVVTAGLGTMDVHVDDVSLRSAQVPATTYDVYLGTNAVPVSADLLGSTTNMIWNLSSVSPITTYYWQIVARRENQTPGPVWQFSFLPTLRVSNASVVEGNAGATNIIFNFSIDVPAPDFVSFDFSTFDGTAISPDDYFATNGTVVFMPGQTNASLSIPVFGDTNGEPSETFLLILANQNNLLLPTNQIIGTIIDDDDSAPELQPIPDKTAYQFNTLVVSNYTFDPNLPQDALHYSLDPGAPIGAMITADTGTFTWTPNAAQGPGSYMVTVRVTDSSTPPLSDAKSFHIQVLPRPSVVSIAVTNSHALITVSSFPGEKYRLQYRPTLLDNWIDIPGDVTATTTNTSLQDPNPLDTRRFYRVMVVR